MYLRGKHLVPFMIPSVFSNLLSRLHSNILVAINGILEALYKSCVYYWVNSLFPGSDLNPTRKSTKIMLIAFIFGLNSFEDTKKNAKVK